MKKIILSMMFAFAFLIPYVKADVEITEATVNLPSVLPQENGDIIEEFSVPSGSNYEPADWFNSGKLRVHYTDDGYGYLSGKYYTYTVTNSMGTNQVVDPYAKSAGLNGKRGMIVNFTKLNQTISGWASDKRPEYGNSTTDASVYEIHSKP